MPAYRHFSIVGVIIAASVVFASGQLNPHAQIDRYGALPVEISQAAESLLDGTWSLGVLGSLSRLFTAIFLHGDFEHILYNMVFLWTFGTLASEHLGPWWALAIFVVTGVCGNIAQVTLNSQSPVPIIGASGAVCGFEGLYLGLALRWQLPWPDVWPLAHPIPPLQLGAFAVLGFCFDAYSLMNHQQGVAYGAHLGGFLAGFALAAIVTTLYPTLTKFENNS